MSVILCEGCFPAWGEHEILTTVPMGPCVQCLRLDYRWRGGIRCHHFRSDPRTTKAAAMTEYDMWAFIRSAMCCGADARSAYNTGTNEGFDAFSDCLDAAATERTHELLRRLRAVEPNA